MYKRDSDGKVRHLFKQEQTTGLSGCNRGIKNKKIAAQQVNYNIIRSGQEGKLICLQQKTIISTFLLKRSAGAVNRLEILFYFRFFKSKLVLSVRPHGFENFKSS
jgi:hypothetical protein